MAKDSLRLGIVEQMIWDSRVTGGAFSEIPEDKVRQATDRIILSAAAITGCGLPETELMATYLSEEIITFINGHYPEYTLEEIITAMRVNALPGLSYTQSLNPIEKAVCPQKRISVEFLAVVLKNYWSLRHQLDRKIENKINGYQ